MKLTKFQHACFTVEKDNSLLVIDPGVYSHDFIIPRHVDGVVITHDHPDHLNPTLIEHILQKHPQATIIAYQTVTAQFAQSPTVSVSPGESYTLGAFTLQFFGGTHAPIAEGITPPPNLGVFIDSSLYYPGDSFTVPVLPSGETVKVETLALPISAPWLDFARTRDFLAAINPSLAFPTHDGILSEDGKRLAEQMVGGFAQNNGIKYKNLDGRSVELP